VRAEQSVLSLSVAQARRRIGQGALQQRQRARSRDLELAHVTQIEDSRRGADRAMLLDDAAVLQRHLETSEHRHSRAESVMEIEEGSALWRIHLLRDPNKPDDRQRCNLPRFAHNSKQLPTAPTSGGGKISRQLASRACYIRVRCPRSSWMAAH